MSASIAPAELKTHLDAGASIDFIDVRTPAEYQSVHAPRTRNVPLDRFDPAAVLAERQGPADTPIYLICHSGARAQQAAEKLAAAGCEQVVLVTGGTQAWERAGLPVERGARRVLPLQQQVHLIIGLGVLVGAALGYFVHPAWIGLSAFFGAGLSMAGLTGACPLAMLVAKLPWNRVHAGATSCSV